MRVRATWLILMAVVALGWSPAGAAPRDPDVPLTNARNDWWMIGKDAKHTTSKCIGNPKTALCAVETVEACLIQRDKKLCDIGAGPLHMFLPNDRHIPPIEKYRVIAAKRLTTQNMRPWELAAESHSFRHAGDVQIEIETRYCWASGECADDPNPDNSMFLVRWSGERWSVVGRMSCTGEPGSWGDFCIGWPAEDQ